MHEHKRHTALLALRDARWRELERQLAQYQGAARQLGANHFKVAHLMGRLQRARQAAQQVEELVAAVERQQA